VRASIAGVSVQPVRFGPERTGLLALVIAVVCALPAAATWHAVAWLLPLALVAAVWLLRARVVVGPDGVEVCNGLGRRRVPWDAVEGFDVPPRGPLRLLHSGRRTVMTAVPHRDARRLVQAAQQASSRAGAA
jgi:hypothetical protein